MSCGNALPGLAGDLLPRAWGKGRQLAPLTGGHAEGEPVQAARGRKASLSFLYCCLHCFAAAQSRSLLSSLIASSPSPGIALTMLLVLTLIAFPPFDC